MTPLCETCGKPDPAEAIERQQEQMRPRPVKEGRALLLRADALRFYGEPADVRMGDIVRVTLIAAAVEDITAGFYCECG